MDAPKTLQQAIQYFADFENCRKFMIAIRWDDGIVRCPICGAEKVTYLANARLYKCNAKHPRQKFSLKVGTVFEDSPIALEKWLPAMWLLSNCKNGISSYELGRAIGVTQKSAWFMLHRIRLAFKSEPKNPMGWTPRDPIEVDETFIGGKPRNMHAKRRMQMGGVDHKVAVMGMLERSSRQVRAKVVPNVKRETLQGEILKNVGRSSHIYTDQHVGYDGLGKMNDYVHKTVNHMEEYVNGKVHTQGIENFWSLLKRGLRGTYVAVEPFHLDRYVDEQVFRYNNRRNKNDSDRFKLAVSQIAGKRLTYEELTGKLGETTPF
jgi:transposase-like protein